MTQEDYLAHHGIPGQSWGTRNGPPYPLSAQAVAKVKKALAKREKEKARKAKALKAAKAKAEKDEIERKAKKAVEDHEKLKDNLRKHPKGIYKNRGQLTQDEVDDIMKSVQFDRRCKDIRRDEYLRGLRIVSDLSDTAKTFHNVLDNSTKMYNDMALIYNAILDARGETGAKRMKKIAWDDSKK